jgi:hypothetical protein
MFIEILYADLSRQKVALEDIDQLKKDEVLCILVSNDTGEGKRKNIASGFGKDFYALCTQRSGNQDWVMLCGWDDDDFVWRRIDRPHGPGGRRRVVAPLGCMHVVFRGQHVEDDVWKEAKRIFSKEMG